MNLTGCYAIIFCLLFGGPLWAESEKTSFFYEWRSNLSNRNSVYSNWDIWSWNDAFFLDSSGTSLKIVMEGYKQFEMRLGQWDLMDYQTNIAGIIRYKSKFDGQLVAGRGNPGLQSDYLANSFVFGVSGAFDNVFGGQMEGAFFVEMPKYSATTAATQLPLDNSVLSIKTTYKIANSIAEIGYLAADKANAMQIEKRLWLNQMNTFDVPEFRSTFGFNLALSRYEPLWIGTPLLLTSDTGWTQLGVPFDSIPVFSAAQATSALQIPMFDDWPIQAFFKNTWLWSSGKFYGGSGVEVKVLPIVPLPILNGYTTHFSFQAAYGEIQNSLIVWGFHNRLE